MSVFQNIEEVDERTITFRLSPTRYQYANTLRRAIQTEVPCLAFRADMKEDGSTSDVKVIKNTTPMSNEMLADRIGLIPIAMPSNVVSTWNRDSVLFKLHVKNDTYDALPVKASDFECMLLDEETGERKRIPNTKFFYPDPVTSDTCLITILKPKVDGQDPDEIELEAYASIGKGKEHTRFNPTCQASYSYTRDTDPGRIQERWVNWLIKQKKVDVNELEKDTKRKETLEREFRSLEIQRCFVVDDQGEPNSFDFTIESIGTMSPYIIVPRALRGLITICEKYSSIDRGSLPEEYLEIRPADARMNGFDFWFTGEDHTLGNLLQTYISDNMIDNERATFVGYKVPHPLRDEMVLRIGVKDGNETSARTIVAESAKACATMFSKWYNEFESLTGNISNVITTRAAVSGKESVSLWTAHEEGKKAQKAPSVVKKVHGYSGITSVKKAPKTTSNMVEDTD